MIPIKKKETKGHRQRATAELATQNRKGRDTMVPLPTGGTIGGEILAIKEAHSGRVPDINSGEEGSREGREGSDGGVVEWWTSAERKRKVMWG